MTGRREWVGVGVRVVDPNLKQEWSGEIGQIGWSGLKQVDDHFEANGLEVNPDYRGQGIAKAIYDFVQQETGKHVGPSGKLSRDSYRLWLDRLKNNPKALDKFKKQWHGKELKDMSGNVQELAASYKSNIRISSRDSNIDRLQEIYAEDQKVRNEYAKYLDEYNRDWKKASQAWMKDNPEIKDSNDIFNDKNRLNEAKQIIKSNIDLILADKKILNRAWLLVQHMDGDMGFQKWFFGYLKESSGESEDPKEYGYLYDRIAINEGRPQKYNTQQVFND